MGQGIYAKVTLDPEKVYLQMTPKGVILAGDLQAEIINPGKDKHPLGPGPSLVDLGRNVWQVISGEIYVAPYLVEDLKKFKSRFLNLIFSDVPGGSNAKIRKRKSHKQALIRG